MPRYSSEETRISFSKNSSAWGLKPSRVILGTVEVQASRSSKGTIRLMVALGAGMSFRVSSVMMPSVPSEPHSRLVRL